MPYRFVTARWLAGLIVAVLAWSTCAWLAFKYFSTPGLLSALVVVVFVMMYFLLEILLRLVNEKRSREMDYEQVQALFGLYTVLKPDMPLFNLRRYAVAPDTAALYLYLLRTCKPETVVELGSGTSTVISGTMVSRNGTGRVIALDDDAYWAHQTEIMLEAHNVTGQVEVRHAPLEEVEINGRKSNWYSLKALEGVEKIDMLLIDGPVDSKDRGNRTPALHLLADRLSEKAVVIADDTSRPNWKRVVLDWADKNDFDVEKPYPNDHETLILRKKAINNQV